MPANLNHRYRRAENAYRQAATPEAELDCLQDMLRELPKHKGTDKLQAMLKQKISAAKKAYEAARANRGARPGLRLPRQGAARVVLLGGPNAGKSQFIHATTRATPEVADYPFTTREITPTIMPFEDIRFQLIDTPPITADVFDVELLGLIRGADLILLLVDLGSDDGWQVAQQVIEQTNRSRSRLADKSYFDEEDIGVSYTQTLLVLNKSDVADAAIRWELFQESIAEFAPVASWQKHHVSAANGDGIRDLQQGIYDALEIVRVYTKSPKDKQPEFANPYTIRRGGTVADVAAQVHEDFAARLKTARVWPFAAWNPTDGAVGVADNLTVKGDHVLHDKDIVEFHI